MTKKSGKPTPAQQIDELQACITECEDKLSASYVAAITQAEKDINQWQVKLTKAKEKLSRSSNRSDQASS